MADIMHNDPLLAGVELGGTKCVCLIGTAHDEIRARERIETGGDPAVALGRIEKILRDWQRVDGAVAAVGIASFGPVDLARQSPTYGFITTTPKPGWRNVDVAQRLARAFAVPVGFDTDVDAAALAEGRWGAARGPGGFAHLTCANGA